MASVSQIDENINNQVNISNIVVVPNKIAADYYIENLFPLFPLVSLFAVDKSIPFNTTLMNRIKNNIITNASINLIVFGADFFALYAPVSPNVLVMDNLIMDSIRTSNYFSEFYSEGFSKKQIVALIMSFCRQGKYIKMPGNLQNAYTNFREYKTERNDLTTLITGCE